MSHTLNEPEACPAYVMSQAAGIPQEIERLDDMHESMRFYLGGRLSLAPLEELTSPRRILEMGSGSGAWAIQAAEQFPDADVLAVDLFPLPSRYLPSNIKFQRIDLTEPFPFESNAFDIVHARFVFIHLPNFEEVLNRTMQLVKPGGWLLLDDFIPQVQDDAGIGPGQTAVAKFWQKRLEDPTAFQRILESSSLFSEVNVEKVVVPVSKWNDPRFDIGLRRMAESLRRSFSQGMAVVKNNIGKDDLTPEIIKAAEEELNDSSRNMSACFYLTWSRRRK